MSYKSVFFSLLFLTLMSCISTKSTLMNVDNNAPIPKLTKQNTFVLTEISNDSKYGFDKDYPVNVFYRNSNDEEINCNRFLNALSGPNGETISFKKTGICCPFPSKNINTGGGFLAVYEISYEGLKNPKILYLNIYEKGLLLAPVGFSIKK
jgi:hypothetical protein